MIDSQLFEQRMNLIFTRLIEGKSNEEIATELKIGIRTVQDYKTRLHKRYSNYQRQKSHDTWFFELELFKLRLLTLYKGLEAKVLDPKTNAVDATRAAEFASNLAVNIPNIESLGIVELMKKNKEAIKQIKYLKNQQEMSNIYQQRFLPEQEQNKMVPVRSHLEETEQVGKVVRYEWVYSPELGKQVRVEKYQDEDTYYDPNWTPDHSNYDPERDPNRKF